MNYSKYIYEFAEQCCAHFGVVMVCSFVGGLMLGLVYFLGVFCSFSFSFCSGIPLFLFKKMKIASERSSAFFPQDFCSQPLAFMQLQCKNVPLLKARPFPSATGI